VTRDATGRVDPMSHDALREGATRRLASALAAHGLAYTEHEDQILLVEGVLGIRVDAYAHSTGANGTTVRFEVRAHADALGATAIVENFAGVGETAEAALDQAFGRWLLGGFHVLLEALTPHVCAEPQAEIENWSRKGAAWRVYSGPAVTQHSGAQTLAEGYRSLIADLQASFAQSASPGPHWISVYIGAYHDKVQAFEVLLDNAPWEEGAALVRATHWSCTHDYQSIRHFVLALPSNETRAARPWWQFWSIARPA
jgi:hypothetical protein